MHNMKIRKYKAKIDQHKKINERMQDNMATHKIFIDEQKEIWE